MVRFGLCMFLCSLLLGFGRAMQSALGRPHIIMVLGDDIGSSNYWSVGFCRQVFTICFLYPTLAQTGFANVGYNRKVPTKEVQTPALDALAAEGIKLTSFYTFKYCSPSRSGFLTGRNPIHVNVVNGQTILVNPDDPVSG